MQEYSEAERKSMLWGMIAAMACWGVSWPSAKVLASYGTSETIGFLRFVVTFLSLAVIIFFAKDTFKISRKGIPNVLMAGICLGIYQLCFLEGVKVGMAGYGGVLVTTLNPFFTAILIFILTKKTPAKLQLIGLGIGLLAGVVLLRLWETYENIERAALIFLLASAVWALLSRFTSTASNYGTPMSFSFWTYITCSVMLGIFTDYSEAWTLLHQTDFYFWFNLIFSATITTAMATTFYFYATSKLGADKASNFMFMVPLSAALGAWLFLDEIPKWNTLIGGSIGLIAVYLLNKKKA